MSTPHPETAAPGKSDLERWAWIVLLLDAVEQAGLAPVEADRFHNLAYFANCLAPVYDLPVSDGKIMKNRRGPFYPDLQWDLDRLVVMGAVTMRSFDPFRDRNGWWFRASYVLPSRSSELVESIRQSPRLARIHNFQVELAFAFADLPDEVKNTTADRDANYADPTVLNGDLIDFAEWDEDNYTELAAESVTNYAPSGVRLNARDRLHLYFRYLKRVPPVPATPEDVEARRQVAG